MNTQKRAALYCRLSREDEQCGGDNSSESITNQILMLTTYAQEHGFHRFEIYIDDGYSGTSLERPDIQRLIEDIEDGLIDTVIVKDRSRIGRNYVEVGKLTEEFFLKHEIRLISVLDGSDSANGADEFSPFRDIMNEWYAKDISKKTRASLQARGREGKKMSSRPIYGYKTDEDGEWIIDEYAAEIVRRIFTMYLNGTGVVSIANTLTKEKILTPMQYKHGTTVKYTEWCAGTIRQLLKHREYVGDTVNFKTVKPSFKSKRFSYRPSQENMIFEGTHEAIISHETFEDVQIMMKIKAGHPTQNNRMKSLFSGLLKCADCGANLTTQHKTTKKGQCTSYICSLYRRHFHQCTSHFIREDDLMKTVAHHLERLVILYDNRLLEKALVEHVLSEKHQTLAEAERQLKSKKDRIDEIDTIIKDLYEDKIKGTIPNDVFLNLYGQFKAEQYILNSDIYDLTKSNREEENICKGVNRFLKIIKGFVKDREAINDLTKEDLLELIDYIVVREKQKGNDCQQRIEIHYRHVGNIENLLPRGN